MAARMRQQRERTPPRQAPRPAESAHNHPLDQIAWTRILRTDLAGTPPLTSPEVLRLQRALGNRVAGRFLAGIAPRRTAPTGREPAESPFATRQTTRVLRSGVAAMPSRVIQRTDFPQTDVNPRMQTVSPALLGLLRDTHAWNIENTLDALNLQLAGNPKAQAGLADLRGKKTLVQVMKDLLLVGDAGRIARLESLAPFVPTAAITQILTTLNGTEKAALRTAVAAHADGLAIRGDMAEILAGARLRRIYEALGGGTAPVGDLATRRHGKLATLGQGAPTTTGGNVECLEHVPGFAGIADYQNQKSRAYGYVDYNDYRTKRALPPVPASATAVATAGPAPGPNQALEAELGRAFAFRQADGKLWKSHGELDLAVVANPPGVKPIIVELQQVKSGAQDLPATAQAQNVTTVDVLKRVRDRDPAVALYQKVSHVQLGANVSAVYDLTNIEQALTTTMGPKGDKAFDEKFEYSADELLQIATTLKGNPNLIV